MVSICLKARYKYKKQALFLSCFGVYTDFISATFCLVFSRHFAVFWVLFLRFLQFQLPFCLVFSGHFAVFWVLFLGFLQFQLLFLGFSLAFELCFGCCFLDFCSFSYFFSGFPWLLGWVWVLFLKF